MCVANDIIRGCVSEDARMVTEQQNKRLQALLEWCQELYIKLNKEKMQLRTKCVKFLDHIIPDSGIHADSETIPSITGIPPPTNATDV